MNAPSDIYDFIKQSEIAYAQEIEVIENWNWNMKEHIRVSLLYKHGKFSKGANDYSRPNKNIVYPILNLRYRAEDIDVKNVNLYVNDDEKYYFSFLVKKYHDEVYAKEKRIDTLFDEMKEEKIDFGGVLARKAKHGPAYEPLESIAFCDQTDILSGPIGFKLFFAPEELYEMEKQGWGDSKNGATATIDELVALAENAKQPDRKGIELATPEKYIEAYRVHGVLPSAYMREDDRKEGERYVRQIHIVAFYKNKEGKDQGVTLYRAREYESPFKLHFGGKKIRNRALAFGGVEELFETQIWTNYSEVRKKEMLDAASKVILQTTDEAYAARNKIKDMENLEITVTKEGSVIGQVPTGSPNIQLFNEWIREWEVQGRFTGGATEAILGVPPSAGTPFKSLELQAFESHGLHDYRRGKYAVFIEEIYRDWILPDIAKELVKGQKFLALLSADELQYVADAVVEHEWENHKKEKIINGEDVAMEDEEPFKRNVREQFMRRGDKRFIEILKDELKNIPLKVQVNVSGKQKELALMVDKFVNVLRQMLATYNPQTRTFAIFDDPRMSKVFSKILEYSGLNPVDFGANIPPPPLPQMAENTRSISTEPLEDFTRTQMSERIPA